MFLIRAAFWITLVLVLLPSGAGEREKTDEADSAPPVGAFEAILAARDAAADMASFCERNPETCRTASALFKVLGERAQDGALMLYDAFGGGEAAPQRGTLTPDDLAEPWHGPGEPPADEAG